MSLFGNLTNEGLEETQDRIGGFSPFESGIYIGTIKTAYAGQSAGGARNVTLIVDMGGREYRETIYITNKQGQNFFLNKDDKTKKVPLPGFTTIDDICLITTGEPLANQEAEDKMVKIYDVEQKKELPKSVPVLTGLVGQAIALGIVKTLENKQTKQGDEYVPSAETREVNTIDKVFHPELKLTVVEARNGADKAAFWDAWEERNKGNTRDKRTIKEGGSAGTAGAPRAANAGPPQASGSGAPRKSLFGNKAA